MRESEVGREFESGTKGDTHYTSTHILEAVVPEWEEKKPMALSQIITENHHHFQSTVGRSV